MSTEQESNSLLLSSKDKVDGFYIVTDKGHDITLLRWGQTIGLVCSAMITEEGLKAFLEVMKDFERSDNGWTQAYTN